MEAAARDFLIDIVNEIHKPQEISPNNYLIHIRYEVHIDSFSYEGDKHRFLCEQVGQEIWIQYPTPDLYVHIYKISLADPDSRNKIKQLFQTT